MGARCIVSLHVLFDTYFRANECTIMTLTGEESAALQGSSEGICMERSEWLLEPFPGVWPDSDRTPDTHRAQMAIWQRAGAPAYC